MHPTGLKQINVFNLSTTIIDVAGFPQQLIITLKLSVNINPIPIANVLSGMPSSKLIKI